WLRSSERFLYFHLNEGCETRLIVRSNSAACPEKGRWGENRTPRCKFEVHRCSLPAHYVLQSNIQRKLRSTWPVKPSKMHKRRHGRGQFGKTASCMRRIREMELYVTRKRSFGTS